MHPNVHVEVRGWPVGIGWFSPSFVEAQGSVQVVVPSPAEKGAFTGLLLNVEDQCVPQACLPLHRYTAHVILQCDTLWRCMSLSGGVCDIANNTV